MAKRRGLGGRLWGKSKGLYTQWTHEIPPEDRRKLRELCIKYKVRLIAHGHMHEAMDRRVNGIRMIGTPASTQPLKGRGKKMKYQYYSYTISYDSNRLKSKLMEVTI